jgi:hypothetical protein
MCAVADGADDEGDEDGRDEELEPDHGVRLAS